MENGVVKLHSYCSEEMVERLVRKLEHDYESMAKLLGVKLDPNQFEQLNGLYKSVVNDARYPAMPSLGKDFFEQTNQITRYNHRQPNFERLVDWPSRYATSLGRLTRIAQTLPVSSIIGQTGDT